MSDDVPIVSVKIPKIIQIWDGRQKVAVEIQKTQTNREFNGVHVFLSKDESIPRVFI